VRGAGLPPDSVAAVIRWREGEVVAVRRAWPGSVELDVVTADGVLPALAHPQVVGLPVVGDRVLLNTTALTQGLGTGGHAFVVAIPDRLPADSPVAGHLVKARYSPLQVTVGGVDEPGTASHDVVAAATDVGGMPVVVADLHSALPAVVAGVVADAPGARVAYVLTDGAALPAAYSRTVARLRATGAIVGCVSTGQTFGGDLEAVTLHSGLLAAARVLDADVAVVTQGPGNLGTATRWGFSGVAAGEALNAAAVLGGRPVAALRISGADPRPRHFGVSHHSLTAYGRVALSRADVVVPRGLPGDLDDLVGNAAAPLGERHRLVTVGLDGLREALAASPVRLETMGRGLDDDPAAFLAAAAAGRHAAALLAHVAAEVPR
jgi:hypothetical protein